MGDRHGGERGSNRWQIGQGYIPRPSICSGANNTYGQTVHTLLIISRCTVFHIFYDLVCLFIVVWMVSLLQGMFMLGRDDIIAKLAADNGIDLANLTAYNFVLNK